LNLKERAVPVESLKKAVEAATEEGVERRQGTQCPRCGSNYFRRMSRVGFLEERIYPLFGHFPWRCTGCGGNFLIKKRGQPMRHQQHSLEPE